LGGSPIDHFAKSYDEQPHAQPWMNAPPAAYSRYQAGNTGPPKEVQFVQLAFAYLPPFDCFAKQSSRVERPVLTVFGLVNFLIGFSYLPLVGFRFRRLVFLK